MRLARPACRRVWQAMPSGWRAPSVEREAEMLAALEETLSTGLEQDGATARAWCWELE